MDVAVRTENLTRRFGETVAVDGLSLSVFRGEVFGFLGHNGAGKTTTVRLLNGVLARRILCPSPPASVEAGWPSTRQWRAT